MSNGAMNDKQRIEELEKEVEEYKRTLEVLDPPSDIPLVKKVEELEKANKELKIADKGWVLATNIMQKKDALIEELERQLEVRLDEKNMEIQRLENQVKDLQSKQLKPLCRGALREYMYPQFQDREYMLDIMCDYICSTFGARTLPTEEELAVEVSHYIAEGDRANSKDIAKAILNKLKG